MAGLNTEGSTGMAFLEDGLDVSDALSLATIRSSRLWFSAWLVFWVLNRLGTKRVAAAEGEDREERDLDIMVGVEDDGGSVYQVWN